MVIWNDGICHGIRTFIPLNFFPEFTHLANSVGQVVGEWVKGALKCRSVLLRAKSKEIQVTGFSDAEICWDSILERMHPRKEKGKVDISKGLLYYFYYEFHGHKGKRTLIRSNKIG